jgi:hypothetical protein
VVEMEVIPAVISVATLSSAEPEEEEEEAQ